MLLHVEMDVDGHTEENLESWRGHDLGWGKVLCNLERGSDGKQTPTSFTGFSFLDGEEEGRKKGGGGVAGGGLALQGLVALGLLLEEGDVLRAGGGDEDGVHAGVFISPTSCWSSPLSRP